MQVSDTDRQFAGSIPQLYERHLVPLIFADFAEDIAARAARAAPMRVLEVAAGTGVVTRALARHLDPRAQIVATDLNAPMLVHAEALGIVRPVQWQQADAQQLPFADGSFDAVVCQFGAMFFPDRPRAYGEARRVLREGGCFLFNVWDRLESNGFAATVSDALAPLFPADPPRFLARVPYGYHDTARIAVELEEGGFARTPEFAVVRARSKAADPREPAMAFCLGTPLRNEIEAREPAGLAAATEAATAAIVQRYGSGTVEAAIQAIVVTVHR
jgi:SAM-dependent methyltransferase